MKKKMPLYPFMLKMEICQHAVIIMAMRWYVFFPWIGQFCLAPVLTSAVWEDKESEKMQMNALKDCFQQWCQPSVSVLLPYSMSASRWDFSDHVVQGTTSSGNASHSWLPLPSPFTDVPFLGHTPVTLLFFKSSPLFQPAFKKYAFSSFSWFSWRLAAL